MRRFFERAEQDAARLGDRAETLAHPLEEPEDLGPLLDRIGDARCVLLGEASHGTSEYYAWRARISERLIQQKGFSFIAVEGDWPDCYEINRYVKGYRDSGESAREALYAFQRWPTWMWANEEITSLVEWLRRHNDGLSEEEKVGFYGLDVYSLWDSLERVMNLAEKPHQDADSAVSTVYRRSPVFRIRKRLLSKFITASRRGHRVSRARGPGRASDRAAGLQVLRALRPRRAGVRAGDGVRADLLRGRGRGHALGAKPQDPGVPGRPRGPVRRRAERARGEGRRSFVYAIHRHIPLLYGLGRPEAVGDMYPSLSCFIAPDRDAPDEEPDEFAPFLKRLRRFGLDLFDAARQSNEPRGG